MKHILPVLAYGYDALEPFMDSRTMELHHQKHHQTYVDKLNSVLEQFPEIATTPLEELLRDPARLPEGARQGIVNFGGGHSNHSLWWRVIGPVAGNGAPSAELSSAIAQAFGSFESFKQGFSDAAAKLFGSGWVWLCRAQGGALKIHATKNQDSPLSEGLMPVLCLDVWEHAYYLKYQNRRQEYIEAWWNVVNWNEVSRLFAEPRA